MCRRTMPITKTFTYEHKYSSYTLDECHVDDKINEWIKELFKEYRGVKITDTTSSTRYSRKNGSSIYTDTTVFVEVVK